MMSETMQKQTWLVTGASRGIGLEMVKQLLSAGCNVVGACRNPDGARDLWEVESDYKTRFRLLKIDVSDASSIEAAAKAISALPIDVLVNNAGILRGAEEGLMTLSFDDVLKSFLINTVGPMRVTKAFMPNLRLATNPKIINITSKMGSIEDNKGGGYYGYRMSKTALNMFNSCLKSEFRDIISVVLHPGWVKTEMGGPSAPTDPYDSVKGLLSVIHKFEMSDSGKFMDFCGQEIKW